MPVVYLASFKRGEPEWILLGVPRAMQLPAVQWRMQNLAKMDTLRRERLIDALLRAVDMGHESAASGV